MHRTSAQPLDAQTSVRYANFIVASTAADLLVTMDDTVIAAPARGGITLKPDVETTCQIATSQTFDNDRDYYELVLILKAAEGEGRSRKERLALADTTEVVQAMSDARPPYLLKYLSY